MWTQINVFGKPFLVPKKAELKDVCCDSCYTAKEPDCVCRCHGAYHGLGNLNKKTAGKTKRAIRSNLIPGFEKVLPEDEAEVFRQQYHSADTYCSCGCDLSEEIIVYYVPHIAGWVVKCEKEKAWLYVKCPKCGTDMAIWKLGVPRA